MDDSCARKKQLESAGSSATTEDEPSKYSGLSVVQSFYLYFNCFEKLNSEKLRRKVKKESKVEAVGWGHIPVEDIDSNEKHCASDKAERPKYVSSTS
ncbi:hypothetical protein KIN20_016303 [Parelaphostrongylus tenuis]|uniref:Uncharacterized protein n=1 Tax=Parelaphostrongylus tenuis TaxID=148309 RepID=A0AAD5N543_PARTN|nr:hypothetical protein KIN20_016303 [Parelaphostrongylus tenuis]